MEFFHFIGDIEKENKEENGGSSPAFGFLAGIFAQKSRLEVKDGNATFRRSFSYKTIPFGKSLFPKITRKMALNLEFSRIFFFRGKTPLGFLFFPGKAHFFGFLRGKKKIHILASFRRKTPSFCYCFIPSDP